MLFAPALLEIIITAGCIGASMLLPRNVAGTSMLIVLIGLWFVVSCIVVLPSVVAWMFSITTITTRSIHTSHGLIWRRTRDLPISRITDVSLEQGLLDRVFGCGTIVLSDAASAEGARMKDVPHVERVRATLDDLMY